SSMSACLKCPSPVPPGAHFCPSCGTSVAPEEGMTRSRPVDAGARPAAAPATPRATPMRASSHLTPHHSSVIDHGRFLPGAIVGGRFRIVAMLGRGGMGEVYRADDLTVGQAVALKFLPPRFATDEERLRRLLDEVKHARDVAHPNV